MKIKDSANREWKPQAGKKIQEHEVALFGCKRTSFCVPVSEYLWAANQIKLSDNRVNSAKQVQFAAGRVGNFALIFGTNAGHT